MSPKADTQSKLDYIKPICKEEIELTVASYVGFMYPQFEADFHKIEDFKDL